jgi:hypothetical protein
MNIFIYNYNATYSSPNFIRMMKSRRVRWAGHVAGIETRNAKRMWMDNIKMDWWTGLAQDKDKWRAL